MTSSLKRFPDPKTLVSVHPVSWLPGTLTGTIPFFSVEDGVLYLRSDDPNLYGITYNGGLTQPPKVKINNVIKVGNKGRNFYSAPWSIPTLPCRDTGKRVEVTSIDPSVYSYITAFYSLLTNSSVNLTNFSVTTKGYARQYQVVNGNMYTNVNGSIYFGGTNVQNGTIGGVSVKSTQSAPLVSGVDLGRNEIIYNGTSITTYQLPYNTFFAIDSPVTIKATDSTSGNTLYFTLQNTTSVYNQYQTS